MGSESQNVFYRVPTIECPVCGQGYIAAWKSPRHPSVGLICTECESEWICATERLAQPSLKEEDIVAGPRDPHGRMATLEELYKENIARRFITTV